MVAIHTFHRRLCVHILQLKWNYAHTRILRLCNGGKEAFEQINGNLYSTIRLLLIAATNFSENVRQYAHAGAYRIVSARCCARIVSRVYTLLELYSGAWKQKEGLAKLCGVWFYFSWSTREEG